MLKVPDSKKYRNLPDHFKEHLIFLPPENTRSNVFVACFVLLDLCILPLLYPLNLIIYYSIIPLLVFIHLWAIRLMIKNPYTTQMELIQFMGLYSAIGAICYFITSIRISYMYLEVYSFVFYFLLLFAHLIILAKLVHFQRVKYSKLNYKRNEDEMWYNSSKIIPYLTAGPAIGYILFQSFKENENVMNSIFLIATLSLTIFFCYFAAKYIHKYKFMKINNHLLTFQKPSDKKK